MCDLKRKAVLRSQIPCFPAHKAWYEGDHILQDLSMPVKEKEMYLHKGTP